MKKNYRRFIAILFCISLALFLTACGGNSNAPADTGDSDISEIAEEGIDIAGTMWSTDGNMYSFYENGAIEIGSTGYDVVRGEYEWDGVMGVIILEDGTYNLMCDEDGDLYLEGEDEELYIMTYEGDVEGEAYESTYGDSEDVRYVDYDSNISVVYSSWLTCLDDAIEGAVTITDENDGLVISQNLTDQYWDYTDSDEDFISDYMNYQITDYFESFYGEDWEQSYYNNMGASGSDGIAQAEMNLYNDGYDIYIRTYIYRVSGGGSYNNIIAQTFFVDYDDYNEGGDQFTTLFNEVGFAMTADED